MKLQNSTSINRVLDSLNIGLESRPAVVSLAAARQIAYELPLPLGRVNSVNAAFDEQLPVVEKKLAEVNEQYLLPNFDEAVATTRRLFTTRYRLAHEPTNPTVAGMIDGCNDTEATGEQLATVSALFNGGDAVVGVESLLYAPCELVAAGLTKASLEAILNEEDLPEFNRQYSQIETIQLQVAGSIHASMESIEHDFDDQENEASASNVPAPAEKKGLLKRLAELLKRFIAWVREKYNAFIDLIMGRAKKREKEVGIAKEVGADKAAKFAADAVHAAEDLEKKRPTTADLEARDKQRKAELVISHAKQEIESATKALNEARSSGSSDDGFAAAGGVIHLIATNAPVWRDAAHIIDTMHKAFDELDRWQYVFAHSRSADELVEHCRKMANDGFIYSPWKTMSGRYGDEAGNASMIVRGVIHNLRIEARNHKGRGPDEITNDLAKVFVGTDLIKRLDHDRKELNKCLVSSSIAASGMSSLDAKMPADESARILMKGLERFVQERVSLIKNLIGLNQVVYKAYNSASAIPAHITRILEAVKKLHLDPDVLADIAKRAGIDPRTLEHFSNRDAN